MDDNRIDPDIFHQDNILGKAFLKVIGHHGMAAVLDDHGRLIKPTNIRKRFNKNSAFSI